MDSKMDRMKVIKMEQRKLFARKPSDMADVYKQTTGRITPAELAEVVKDKNVIDKTCKDWVDLSTANLSEHQFWKVLLEKEDELLLVDTSGYNYPRYVGLLERQSDASSPKDKLKAYKEHFFVMMNDLSKDELIQQIWDSKPIAEKLEEATEFSRTMDW